MPLIKASNVPSSLRPFSMADVETYAKGILLRAQEQADQLLSAAQMAAEALKQQAHTQGHAEGHREGTARGLAEGTKAGHAQALAEHKVQLGAALSALTQAAGQFDSSRQDLYAQGLREVIELAAAIARRVTKRQAMLDPAVLAANLDDAMKRAVHAADVRIAVHPAEMKTLKEELPKLQLAWPRLKHVEMTEDSTLTPGGCRIFTTNGMVDGDLNEQLDRVIGELLPIKEQAD